MPMIFLLNSPFTHKGGGIFCRISYREAAVSAYNGVKPLI